MNASFFFFLTLQRSWFASPSSHRSTLKCSHLNRLRPCSRTNQQPLRRRRQELRSVVSGNRKLRRACKRIVVAHNGMEPIGIIALLLTSLICDEETWLKFWQLKFFVVFVLGPPLSKHFLATLYLTDLWNKPYSGGTFICRGRLPFFSDISMHFNAFDYVCLFSFKFHSFMSLYFHE